MSTSMNTLEYAKIFMEELDKQLVEISTSGWMEQNAGQVKYNGGNEVKIPKISLSGLGDYDRDKGFVDGSVTLAFQTKTLTQDRGRTFQLDAMDVDETNFVAVAGNVIGEFQRTKVVPEIDAYRYSKIASLAMAASKKTEYTPTSTDILENLLTDIAKVQDLTGSGTELVITMATPVATLLSTSKELSHSISVMDFVQGGISLKVKGIDGNPIIAVPSARMKTAYTIYDGTTSGQETGGITPATDANDITV